MNEFSIFDLISMRQSYPLGQGGGDAWVDEILENNHGTACFITTENLSQLHGAIGREKKKILFERYNILGIFGLSNPMVGTGVNLILLVLHKQSNNLVLSGSYNKGLYFGRSYRMGLSKDSSPLDVYPSDYKEYCKKVEQWVINGVTPIDGDGYTFNSFNSKDINFDKLYPQHYSNVAYDIFKLLKDENTVPLSDIASVIRPRAIRGERAKVIHVRDFTYPLTCESVSEGWKTDTIISKGDIIIKNGMTNKIYLLLDDINENIYAGANDLVIRPNKVEEAAYIISYIQSETGKIIIGANTTGIVLPRMNRRNWEQIPIILPKKPVLEYEKHYKLQHYKHKSASEYNEVFNSLLQVEDAKSIEDILNLEMIRTVKIYKDETIRDFLEEDLKELNACYRARAYKATLIMCGSILEAILIDWISEKHKKNYFQEDLYISGNNGRRKKASLYDYINTIKELKKPDWMEEAQKAHTIRNKRNLVHAKLCLESDIINRELSLEVINYLKDVLKTRGFILS